MSLISFQKTNSLRGSVAIEQSPYPDNQDAYSHRMLLDDKDDKEYFMILFDKVFLKGLHIDEAELIHIVEKRLVYIESI